MGQLVVNFREDGTVETLLKDSSFDTRMFGGAREIARITIIEFDPLVQRFYIQWLKGPYANCIHDDRMDEDILGDGRIFLPEDTYALFDTYDEAVAHEIKCVNALRLKGIHFDE